MIQILSSRSAGATIALTADNVTQTKQTDAYGAATFGVISSTLYSYDISAPNYQPRSGTVNVMYDDQNVQFWLLSGNRYSFIVKDKDTQSPLADAQISIDSVPCRKNRFTRHTDRPRNPRETGYHRN